MIVTRDTWRAREDAHVERARALTAEHRARRARRETHPVWDFLFEYYPYRPAALEKWHPGSGIELADAARDDRATWRWYVPATAPGSLMVDAAAFAAQKPGLTRLVDIMLRRTAQRPGQFDCFGLHEWAMVYRQDDHRHSQPLRLGQRATDAVVDAHELRCTHVDAIRFFTDDAAPRNQWSLTRSDQTAFEQPGCLHAGMDVYKWAAKLGPLVPGELLLDAFELARDIRLLDMAAAPYDLSDFGVRPVEIETTRGKAEYVRRQRSFAQRGNRLRSAILDAWQGTERTATAA